MLIHFDYDGVLVDSFCQVLGIAQSVQTRLGLGREPVAEDLRAIHQLTLKELGRVIGIPEERAGEYAAEVFHMLRDDFGNLPVLDGMAEVLRNLSRKHTLAIMTANAREVVGRVLRQSGLDNFIREIFDGGSPDSKAEKINASMEKFGFARHRTFMVGDALSDITEGKKAGVKTIAVTWGYQPRERLIDGNPDYIIDKPAELLEIFQEHEKGKR